MPPEREEFFAFERRDYPPELARVEGARDVHAHRLAYDVLDRAVVGSKRLTAFQLGYSRQSPGRLALRA